MGRPEGEADEILSRPSLPASRRKEWVQREVLQAGHGTDAESLRRRGSISKEARSRPASEASPYHSNLGSAGESGIQEGGETNSHRRGEEGGGGEAGRFWYLGGETSSVC